MPEPGESLTLTFPFLHLRFLSSQKSASRCIGCTRLALGVNEDVNRCVHNAQ